MDFFYAYDSIIAIQVNSKQLRENEKLPFVWIFNDKIL